MTNISSLSRFLKSALALLLASGFSLNAESVAAGLLGGYEAIESLSCSVRRETPLESGGSMKMLSRVHFSRGDKMHVENISPLPRLIVCDGLNFRSYPEGAEKGFGTTVDKLPENMLLNLRSVPGSAEMALRQLLDAEERELPDEKGFSHCVGYDNGTTFTVLKLDERGRLARLDIFDGPEMKTRVAGTAFESYREVLPGVWISMLQKSEALISGKMRKASLRISRLEVNAEQDEGLFEIERYFEGVEFSDTAD